MNPVCILIATLIFMVGLYFFLDKFKISIFNPIILTIIALVLTFILIYMKITNMDSRDISTFFYTTMMLATGLIAVWKDHH